jgi:hypothetical protein
LDKFNEIAFTKEKDYFDIIEKMNNLRNNAWQPTRYCQKRGWSASMKHLCKVQQ